MKDLDDAIEVLAEYNNMPLGDFVVLLRKQGMKLDEEYVKDWKFTGLNNVALYRLIKEDNNEIA